RLVVEVVEQALGRGGEGVGTCSREAHQAIDKPVETEGALACRPWVQPGKVPYVPHEPGTSQPGGEQPARTEEHVGGGGDYHVRRRPPQSKKRLKREP